MLMSSAPNPSPGFNELRALSLPHFTVAGSPSLGNCCSFLFICGTCSLHIPVQMYNITYQAHQVSNDVLYLYEVCSSSSLTQALALPGLDRRHASQTAALGAVETVRHTTGWEVSTMAM
jgi:hypothetical protein